MKPSAIAEAVGRDLSCICRLLKQKKVPKPVGRPILFTEAQADKTVEVLEAMVNQADAEKEVTLAMVMNRASRKGV